MRKFAKFNTSQPNSLANEFISSLPFTPTEDKDQEELVKPIGFDDRTEGVMVESDERKYEKRLEQNSWVFEEMAEIMRDKLGTLNSAEREKFFKEAPNIVSRLKEETQTFKDARYVIREILWIAERKEDLHKKNLYEILELFVLGDFQEQLWEENKAFEYLKSHEEIWTSSFENWRRGEDQIDNLKKIQREKYTTNFYFRCFISQLTGQGWIHIETDWFVSEDLKLWKLIPGQGVDNSRVEIPSYEIEKEDKKHEMLYFSHYEQIPLERIVKALKKEQKKMERIIKLYLKHLIPIEDSEKNNGPFNLESINLHASFEYNGPYPFPHYIFQLRNPPRPICQKNHSWKCQMDGFRKTKGRFSNLPKELHIPVCGGITVNEVLFLESYLNCMKSERYLILVHMEHPFLFLCCQNLLDIPFLILLDHPNNYGNGESIPGLDFERKLHHIDVGVLREYFQEAKFTERLYALIKGNGFTPYIRLIDYQGKPKTKWLDLEKMPNSASYDQFTNQRP